MASTLSDLDSLSALLDASSRPIYAIDSERRIIYCNPALAAWLELEPDQVIGRIVEYHSEPATPGAQHGSASPLAELCPPPLAFFGQSCAGTISSLTRDGGLVHRQAEFSPLHIPNGNSKPAEQSSGGVLILLSQHNLSAQELSNQLAGKQPSDELHRLIRQFRRDQADRFAIETLLGESSAMCKVRTQVAAAAASGANALIVGRRGSGRGHVARAIHYRAVGDAEVKLVPVDCELASEDLLRRALAAVIQTSGELRLRPTLLLENLDCLAESHQSHLASKLSEQAPAVRLIATSCPITRPEEKDEQEHAREDTDGGIERALADQISTITIHVPQLVDRPEDLPMLAQFFLEAANQGSDKQLGSVRADALDLLALHTWPGELDELREVITAAHQACTTHVITPADLPAVVHHASKAAAQTRREPERIELDALLAEIEREAILRALTQSGGNKSEAAELLGLTRPRLYRRLLQLGLAGPEFIEQESNEESP